MQTNFHFFVIFDLKNVLIDLRIIGLRTEAHTLPCQKKWETHTHTHIDTHTDRADYSCPLH